MTDDTKRHQVEADERAAFTAYLHEVIHEDRCDGGVIKVQRHETLSVDEERIALEAWLARAALEHKS